MQYSKHVFNGLEAIYVNFLIPTKNKKLQDMQKSLRIYKVTLLSISDTRWACRHSNCKAVIVNFTSIINVLRQEIDDNNDRNVIIAISKLIIIGICKMLYLKYTFIMKLFLF